MTPCATPFTNGQGDIITNEADNHVGIYPYTWIKIMERDKLCDFTDTPVVSS